MNIVRNRCLYLSRFLYAVCRLVDRKSDYKINIVLKFFKDSDMGHAWLTRNDVDFLHLGSGFNEQHHVLMGQDKKYRYYIHTRNFEKWANNELANHGKSLLDT